MYVFKAFAIFNADDNVEDLGIFDKNNVCLKHLRKCCMTLKFMRKCLPTVEVKVSVIFTWNGQSRFVEDDKELLTTIDEFIDHDERNITFVVSINFSPLLSTVLLMQLFSLQFNSSDDLADIINLVGLSTKMRTWSLEAH